MSPGAIPGGETWARDQERVDNRPDQIRRPLIIFTGARLAGYGPLGSTPQPGAGRKIALYFTGRQHAGENHADVLKQRGTGPECARSDVRRSVAQCAQTVRGRGDSGGQLSGGVHL